MLIAYPPLSVDKSAHFSTIAPFQQPTLAAKYEIWIFYFKLKAFPLYHFQPLERAVQLSRKFLNFKSGLWWETRCSFRHSPFLLSTVAMICVANVKCMFRAGKNSAPLFIGDGEASRGAVGAVGRQVIGT